MIFRIRSLPVTIVYSMLFRFLEVYYRDLMFKILRFSTALGDYNKCAKVPNPIFKKLSHMYKFAECFVMFILCDLVTWKRDL